MIFTKQITFAGSSFLLPPFAMLITAGLQAQSIIKNSTPNFDFGSTNINLRKNDTVKYLSKSIGASGCVLIDRLRFDFKRNKYPTLYLLQDISSNEEE